MKHRFFLWEFLFQIRRQGSFLQRRLALLLLTTLFSVTAVLLLLLNVFGILDPTGGKIDRALTQMLDYSTGLIENGMEQLAAHTAVFSEELSGQLAVQGISLDGLRDNKDALLLLQARVYDTVRSNMRMAHCSGAFFLLNTTVNDSLPDASYSGIYLKYASLNSDTTVRNQVCMYRGSPQVARQNGINLHSTWEYETREGTFPQAEAVLEQEEADPQRGYLLTTVYKLPGAWERVRLLCAPVSDENGHILGVCGFELSDLFFKLSYHASAGEQSHAVCALLTKAGEEYDGQLSADRPGYAPYLNGPLAIREGEKFSTIFNEEVSFVGKTAAISVGSSRHIAAVLLPESLYRSAVRTGQLAIAFLLLVMAGLAIVASQWLSLRYVRPILQTIAKIKVKQFDHADIHIPEIDNLFDFLAEQERLKNAEVAEIQREKEDARITLEQLQIDYGKLRDRHKQLAESKKDEVYPEEYLFFLKGISELSKKERKIFDCYLQGKSVKEISEQLGISEDGVRYHNKNIYAKLGVDGLKQLRMFISILKQENAK